MSDMKTDAVFFGFSFRHHGPHTAFHGLASALSDQTVIDASPPWPRWTPHALEWRLNWRWLRAAEYRLLPYYRDANRRVIHYFFPENTMVRAANWKRHHTVIATCHQPVERMRERVSDPRDDGFLRGLRASDVIVVQCESHIIPYRDLFPGIQTACIPLGVDTLFFRRKNSRGTTSAPPRVLTVGNWLRDYTTWAAVVKQLRTRNRDIEFVVVANADTQAAARNALGHDIRGVQFLRGISDEALRTEYEKASVFYLPLTSAMANDALLEALSMGTPMVVTDLSATRDYAANCALYTGLGEVDGAVDTILNLLNDPAKASDMGNRARMHAERTYDWNVIAKSYRTLYRGLI